MKSEVNLMYRNSFAELSSTAYTIIWVVAIIACLILLFLISFLVTILLVKKAQKKAYKALDDLVPYEKERFQAVLKMYDLLVQEKKLPAGKNPLSDIMKEQEITLSGNTIDMQKAKANDDFAILFLQKFLKERSLKMKEPFHSALEELKKYDVMLDEKNSPYKKYNDCALKYNALSSMMTVSGYCQRKGYLKAPIL